MRKKKILFLTDPVFLKTGLSRNITALLKYLWATNKYDIVHVCCGTVIGSPELQIAPWKCVGVLPPNQQQLDAWNKDGRIRLASYGLFEIDNIIKEERPDIFVGSNDSWSFQGLPEREWFQKINSILHITLDSLPIKLDQQKQAELTKNYFTWTSFAEKELKRLDLKKFGHVSTLHGTLNSDVFKPVSLERKKELKRQFGISEDTMIVSMVSRNQLRKQFYALIEGLVKFKKQHPGKKVKVLFNTTNEQWRFDEIIHGLMYKQGYEGLLKWDDVLFGYYCRNCKKIDIHPWGHNDGDCRLCGAQKSQIIPNIKECADEEELANIIYGISDCYCHSMTSGGLEWAIPESMLCGLPVATIPYSCGTEFTDQNFVYPISFTKTRECESGFWKAVPDDDSICKFYNKMYDAGSIKRKEIGAKCREWALKEFDINNVGKKWEELFDKLPIIDYTQINFAYKQKPETYALKDIPDNLEFIKDLYKGILLLDMKNDDDGVKNWLNNLKAGQSRQDILNYFLNVARNDNQKNKPIDFGESLGKEDKKERILLCQPETNGDIFLVTSLLKDMRELYPDKKIYFACKPQFMDILKGISEIDYVIPWAEFMDNEILMENKYFNMVFQCHANTQRYINYLRGGCDKTNINYQYK